MKIIAHYQLNISMSLSIVLVTSIASQFNHLLISLMQGLGTLFSCMSTYSADTLFSVVREKNLTSGYMDMLSGPMLFEYFRKTVLI